MNTIHPDLHKMQEQFDKICAAYEAEQIKYDTAADTISKLSVVDGKGWVWGINIESGEFTRTAPGGTPVEANPAEFQVPTVPRPAPEPGRRPGAPVRPTPVATPPSARTAGSTPVSAPGAVSAPPWASGTSDLLSAPTAATHVGGGLSFEKDDEEELEEVEYRPKSLRNPLARKGPKKRSLAREEGKKNPEKSANNGNPIVAVLWKNKGTIIVVAICAVVLALVLAQRGNSVDSGEGLPKAPTSTAPLGELPSDGAVQEAPAEPELPTQDVARNIGSALTSGNLDTAASVITNADTGNAGLLNAGQLAGYKAAGLEISYGPIALEGESPVEVWTLVDTKSNQEVATAKMQFVNVDGKWKVSAWPVFAAK